MRSPAVPIILALFFLAGCGTAPQAPVARPAESPWQVRQGQAIWRISKKGPELAGELVLATNTSGGGLVEFTKTPLSLVTAQTGPAGWSIEFPPQKRAWHGHGVPPARFAWLQLLQAWRSEKLASPWRFSRQDAGGWRLEHPRRGEILEGYLQP